MNNKRIAIGALVIAAVVIVGLVIWRMNKQPAKTTLKSSGSAVNSTVPVGVKAEPVAVEAVAPDAQSATNSASSSSYTGIIFAVIEDQTPKFIVTLPKIGRVVALVDGTVTLKDPAGSALPANHFMKGDEVVIAGDLVPDDTLFVQGKLIPVLKAISITHSSLQNFRGGGIITSVNTRNNTFTIRNATATMVYTADTRFAEPDGSGIGAAIPRPAIVRGLDVIFSGVLHQKTNKVIIDNMVFMSGLPDYGKG